MLLVYYNTTSKRARNLVIKHTVSLYCKTSLKTLAWVLANKLASYFIYLVGRKQRTTCRVTSNEYENWAQTTKHSFITCATVFVSTFMAILNRKTAKNKILFMSTRVIVIKSYNKWLTVNKLRYIMGNFVSREKDIKKFCF